MKKSIVILIFLSLKSLSQTTISLISIQQPLSVCKCDSVYASIKVQGTLTPAFNYSLYFGASVPSTSLISGGYEFVLMSTFKNTDFFKMVKTQQLFADTVYSFWQRVPCNISKYSSSGLAILDLCLSPTTNAPKKTIGVKDCATGIQELTSDSIIPVYYDMQGNKILKRTNELIVEQIGNSRRKIFIQE